MGKVVKTVMVLILSSCLVTSSFNLPAQVVTQGSSHFFVGYGEPNFPAIIVGVFGGNGSTGVGPYTLTYQYGILKNLAIGAQIGYVDAISNPTSWESGNGNNIQTLNYVMDLSIFTAMVKVDYHYRKRKRGDFYSGIAAGYGLAKMSFTGHQDPGKTSLKISGFIYSVNGFGYRWMMTKNIGLFEELGYGAMGICTVGLSVKFGGEENEGWRR